MTSQHAFDRAVALEPISDGHFRGHTIPEYANFNGQFGGITAAALMRAVLNDPRVSGTPVSITANYCAAVEAGPFEISVRLVRAGRTIQHWAAEMLQGPKAVATALVTLASRTESYAYEPAKPPLVPPPQDVAPRDNGNWKGWTATYDFRFVEGSIEGLDTQTPFDAPQSAKSVLWLGQKDPRLLDFPSLTCMSDAFFVRLIQVRNQMAPMGTVSITTYFHCDEAMLAAQGHHHVLCHVDSRVFRSNFHDQSAELWSHDGKLLANTHQIVWYAQ
jgi:acyl-CoA thioesterase